MRAAGVRGQVAPERGLGDLQDEGLVEGAQRGRALAALDQGHLAEAVPGAPHGHLLAGLGDHEVPGEHHEHRVPLVALLAEGLARGEHHLAAGPHHALEVGLGECRTAAPPGAGPRACRRAPPQAPASRSSAATSLTRKPSRSVETIPSLPQRLMMRMLVSIVVPVRSRVPGG